MSILLISIGVTVISIIVTSFSLAIRHFNSKCFDEYSTEIANLINYLKENHEDIVNGKINCLLDEILRMVYRANLFSLKKKIVRASLMWLFENGNEPDIVIIRRASKCRYIRCWPNRIFSKIVIEKLSGNNPYV